MNLPKLTNEMMLALMESNKMSMVDGCDQEPTIESDTKTSFVMNKHHDVRTGDGPRAIRPVGMWEVKVTLELTYTKFEE